MSTFPRDKQLVWILTCDVSYSIPIFHLNLQYGQLKIWEDLCFGGKLVVRDESIFSYALVYRVRFSSRRLNSFHRLILYCDVQLQSIFVFLQNSMLHSYSDRFVSRRTLWQPPFFSDEFTFGTFHRKFKVNLQSWEAVYCCRHDYYHKNHRHRRNRIQRTLELILTCFEICHFISFHFFSKLFHSKCIHANHSFHFILLATIFLFGLSCIHMSLVHITHNS